MKRGHYCVIVDVTNARGGRRCEPDEVLSQLNSDNIAPAGFIKTFWVAAKTEQEAAEKAGEKARDHAATLSFFDTASVVIDRIAPCSWWTYLRKSGHPGASFYLSED
ncbi:MAG: hypothetical protein AAFQ67_06585 [Pseudomonadota bacterium]